jgi:pre-mRNA-splicing factor SYF1
LESVNPKKATPNFYRLYVNFAKFYEEGGTAGQAEPDLGNARKIFEKATKVPFKTVEDLAEVWCEWAEMELRAECGKLFFTVTIISSDMDDQKL